MSDPLVVVDADVLGRHRTGDETYVLNLLRELGASPERSAGLRFAAVTRHPKIVPDGIEPLQLTTPSQELRMAWALPRLLRRVGAALVHTQYALPLRAPCPRVVTIHDLSFERDRTLMRRRDGIVFRRIVPWSARRAARVLTVSERTKRDLVELYGLPPGSVVVTPNGIDPAFRPGDPASRDYVLSVGALEPRKDQLAILEAARVVGLPLVVVGPERDAGVARALRSGGATLRGYVDVEELAALYRGAACLVQASRYEGFGLPVVEAMASGTPVVIVPDAALLEVAGGAAVVVREGALAEGVADALARRDALVAAGLERAKQFSWRAAADRTIDVYREVLAR